ncbi:hypothetical protein ACHAXA_006157 [Cyclostephanos tholiformis]|uniref:2Fe-2S ferredoxin-type domain-containing protein n=1 Tax=Cyclostephanos tholiformis TaxID=382380 RepID=A0ABD3RY74_9STRA
MTRGLAGRYEVGEDAGLASLATSVELELERERGRGGTVRVWCLPPTGWSVGGVHDPPDSVDLDHGHDPNDDDDDESSSPLPIIHSMERAFAIDAIEGTTLTDVVKYGISDNSDVLGEYLECACSGIMACSTCHVVIHPDWYDATAVAVTTDGDENDDDGSSMIPPPSTTTTTTTTRKKVGPPTEAEQDMIDLSYEPTSTSRLGCQLVLTSDMDGMVILLPRGSNNMMDHIPFE